MCIPLNRTSAQARREGESREEIPGPQLSWGPELNAVLTHGEPLGFKLQATVHKNTFLFISLL